MKKTVRVKLLEDSHYVIKYLNRRKVNIYNIEYNGNGNIYTIDEDDIDKIPLESEVLNYSGLKGIILKCKRHKHLIIALLMSIVLMYFLSNVTFQVEIIHNDKHIRQIIEDELFEFGIHPFMLKKSFNQIQKIKDKIKNDYKEDIEWLEIIDEGMKYTVRVEERIITKDTEENLYCDVESEKDAIVISSSVSAGQLVVDASDAVKKGSLLVSGAVKFREETKSYVCAEAEVFANTWYTVNVSVPLNHKIKNYTNNKSNNITLLLGSKKVSIFKVHFKEYDTKRKKIFTIGKFTLYKDTNLEYISKHKKYSLDAAKEVALKKGREKILTNLEDTSEILSEKVLQTNEYDSIIDMEIFYSVKENIAHQVEKEIPEYQEGVTSDEVTE